MEYSGRAEKARMMFRSGTKLKSFEDTKRQYWKGRSKMVFLNVPPPISPEYPISNLDDDDIRSLYISPMDGAKIIDIDLQDYRDITGIIIRGEGGSQSPKRCIVQYSMASTLGPYLTKYSFVSTNGTEEQRFMHFNRKFKFFLFE